MSLYVFIYLELVVLSVSVHLLINHIHVSTENRNIKIMFVLKSISRCDKFVEEATIRKTHS